MKYKEIFFRSVLISLVIVGASFWYFDNYELEEEDLALSITYMKNITRIENAEIDLDFYKKQLRFTSQFHSSGTGIMLDLGSRGFVDHDNKCNDNVFLEFKNGGGQTLTPRDKQILKLDKFPEITLIELSRTCNFENDLIPNGELTVHLFNETQAQSPIIDDIQFTTSFNDNRYGCRDICVFTRQLDFEDSNNQNNVRTIKLAGKEIDARSMIFSLRTFDKQAEDIANFAYAIFIGLIIASLGIGYDFVKEKQKKNS